ncbi:hypothetical protein NEUTE1DRAFT_115070 [Neurospora tetrasperma FGSC 2508]|uniref:Uncharacterized protein n=1 Tax=Neurospora tetrasperma (strain FGSC 2508 / ATCC MYA-4615 / P0657) TaxID=510951 RepID=F8N201_NEUT8|nr:uncharacterized protein NEUTE1DRAFT_115070 [Neurospora tetrasperma FGSC 2508]EGO53225.1 hypothetical protein NEUTE1DRAFT_115070 [Neurospora tetrasperma FGSC 2508]
MTTTSTAIIKNTYRNGDGHRIFRCCSARLTRKKQRPETTTASARQSLCDHSRFFFVLCMHNPSHQGPLVSAYPDPQQGGDVSHLRSGGGKSKTSTAQPTRTEFLMGQVVFGPIEEQLTGKPWPPTRSPRLPGLVFAETEQFRYSHRLYTSTRVLVAFADASSIVF